ncbi:MAG: substrate-binding domain-containing protein [Fodinibius sp.]|nr:substrate-binding domain-containing protein [Fodinibius sp.]
MFSQVENIIKRQWADGYLFISTHLRNNQLKKLKDYDMPITLIDESYEGMDSVMVDNEKGIEKAMHYFLENGLRRIGMISGLKSSKPGQQRIDGYRRALKEADLAVDESLIVSGDSMDRDGFTEQNGYEAMLKLLKMSDPPEACFCASDIQAVGALKAMEEEGTHIPIIGYDDITISNYIGLSTIRQPMHDMGVLATKKLVERMGNNDIQPTQKVFSPELILRSSTQKKAVHGETS